MNELTPTSPILCPSCGTECAATLLDCPRCHRLFHAEALKRLAQEAERATREDDLATAQAAWREALELLPPNSRQYEAITARLVDLSRHADAPTLGESTQRATGPQGARSGAWSGKAGAAGAGTAAIFLWKFKFLAVMALTKGKLLLLGLTKGSTLFSMLLSAGVYWTQFGWRFAVGLVLSIYVHEMGHVAALRRYGIKAGAPVFIPGLGAIIRLRQTLPDARADARVGLAGPIWGLAGVLATYAASLATGSQALAAIARFAAWINLFNLLPVWQLDGSRGFRAMSRSQRWVAALAIATMWSLTGDSLLVVIGIAAAIQALAAKPSSESDQGATIQYITLVVSLSALTMIPVGR